MRKVKKVKKLQAAPSRPARSAVADEYSAAYATWGVQEPAVADEDSQGRQDTEREVRGDTS